MPSIRRTVTRDLTLAGTDLPAGAQLFVAFSSTGRDGARFDDPDTFDITRESSRNLAFGHGVHGCPGKQLGRDQARIALEVLVRRLPEIKLIEPLSTTPVRLFPGPSEPLHVAW